MRTVFYILGVVCACGCSRAYEDAKPPANYPLHDVSITLFHNLNSQVLVPGFDGVTVISIRGDGLGTKRTPTGDTLRFTVPREDLVEVISLFYETDYFVRDDLYRGRRGVLVDESDRVVPFYTMRTHSHWTWITFSVENFEKEVGFMEEFASKDLNDLADSIRRLVKEE